MKIKYDVSEVERGGQQPDPGLYHAKIAKVEDGQARSGNQMLTVTFKIVKGKFKNATIRTWIVYADKDGRPAEQSAWKLAEFVDAVGLKTDRGTLDTDKLVGKELQIKVDGDTYEGNYQAKVGRLTALPDEDEVEDEDDDEEDEDDTVSQVADDEDEDDEDDEDDDEDDDEEEDLVDYYLLTLPELQKECKTRGIRTLKGQKSKTLIALLEADDEDTDPFG